MKRTKFTEQQIAFEPLQIGFEAVRDAPELPQIRFELLGDASELFQTIVEEVLNCQSSISLP